MAFSQNKTNRWMVVVFHRFSCCYDWFWICAPLKTNCWLTGLLGFAMMLHEIGGVEMCWTWGHHWHQQEKRKSNTNRTHEAQNISKHGIDQIRTSYSGHAAGRGVRHVDRLGERGRCGKVGGDGGGVASHAVIVRWCCDSCDMKKT